MAGDSDAAGSKSQHARFLETARALGCDEDEAAFDEKLKGIAKPKATDGSSLPSAKTEPK